MNIQYHFTRFTQRSLLLALFVSFMLNLQAQCTLNPFSSPVAVPIAMNACQSQTFKPSALLSNLAVNCPDGLGAVTFNLKIYDAAGVNVIFDSSLQPGGDAVGSNGNFPVVNTAALNIAGIQRKARVQRILGGVPGQFVDLNIIFQIPIQCTSPTMEANDDMTFSNPAILPTTTSGCTIPSTGLCVIPLSESIISCASASYKVKLRTIKSTDYSTTDCSQSILIRKINIANITFPVNYTDPANRGCTFSAANRHPVNTGFPILVANNKPLGTAASIAGKPDTFSNAIIKFVDVAQTSSCTGEIFVKRTWTIEDMCGAATRTFTQDIISKENNKPTIQPIAAITIDAAPTSCNALNFQIPMAVVTDNCSTPIVTATITSNSVAIPVTNGAVISSLAPGVYNIHYTATDNCGNASFLDVPMTIQDATAPSITCSAKMISLNSGGIGVTSALKFVDQLNDNCGASLNLIAIKRMNDPVSAYSSSLTTTCADVNKPFMVILKAVDVAGNPNYCMTTAEVQDKLAPQFVQLADTIVNCPVDTNYLKSLNPIVTDGCTIKTLTKQITNWTLSNCQTGTFNMVYTATDPTGNVSTMTRKVTVTNPNPFVKSMITRPKDIVIKNFNGSLALLEPEKLDTGAFAPAIPKWNYNGCDLVAVSRKDDVFYVNGSSCCFKIFRTWKVANCCMMDPVNPGPKVVDEFIQVIKIEDTLPPEIKGLPDTPVEIGTTNCLATVDLPKPTFIADCAGSLPLSVIVTSSTMPNKSATDQFKYTNVPKGTYVVTYSASDACGNVGTRSVTIVVKDLTVPKLTAYHGLSSNLDMNTGDLMLNAKTFVNPLATSDNCTPFNKMIFAFSKDTKDTTVMFDCNSFKAFCDSITLAFPISLWARDEAGNWTNVNTYIVISKANTVCSCFKNIAGAIQTSKGDKVQDVLVNITSNGVSIIKPFTTNASGTFSIPTVTSGVTYTVAPKKNNDAINGVSTADLVLITKHILGQQTFTSPYQWIAADVNKSGKVTTADIVELRKIILGMNTIFTNNNSWRFVDKSYSFVSTKEPLTDNFPEVKQVIGSNSNTDFIAVKIGDINSTAIANNANTPAGTRSGEALELMINDMPVKVGNTYTITVKAKDLDNIAGYQFTLNFDKNKLEFVDVKDADNGADADFGLTHLQDGVITTSWMNPTSIPFGKMETLFSVTFKAKDNATLAQLLKLSSDFTSAEAYTQSGDEMKVNLSFMQSTTATVNVIEDKFELFQNQPNPFRGATTVSFNLPAATHATLTVFDQTGRLVQKIDDDFNKGRNEIKLDVPAAAGLYFYKLDTPEHSATRKMLLLD